MDAESPKMPIISGKLRKVLSIVAISFLLALAGCDEEDTQATAVVNLGSDIAAANPALYEAMTGLQPTPTLAPGPYEQQSATGTGLDDAILYPPTPEVIPVTPTLAAPTEEVAAYNLIVKSALNVSSNTSFRDAFNTLGDSIYTYGGGQVLTNDVLATGEHGVRALYTMTDPSVFESLLTESVQNPRLIDFITTITSGVNSYVFKSDVLNDAQKQTLSEGRYGIATMERKNPETGDWEYDIIVNDREGKPLFRMVVSSSNPYSNRFYEQHKIVGPIEVYSEQGSSDLPDGDELAANFFEEVVGSNRQLEWLPLDRVQEMQRV